MQSILLNEEQSSLVSRSRGPVQVRDFAGNLLGRVVTGPASGGSVDTDHWVECWKEWYFETEEFEEAAAPQAAAPVRIAPK